MHAPRRATRLHRPAAGLNVTADHAIHDDPEISFHAGSHRGEDGRAVTAGGRVLAVVAQADDFDTAFERVYGGLERVSFEGMTYRRDIGHQVRTRQAASP